MATAIKDRTGARPIVLTIAGFDPSSGAGVTADLKVFAAHGLYGMSCITALTVQSTMGVKRVAPLSAATIRETVETLRKDVAFAGVKIGMLATKAAVEVAAAFLRDAGIPRQRVVLDPVLRSSSGAELLEPAGIDALQQDLLGMVGCVTPNLDELAVLIGRPVRDRLEVPLAAARLQDLHGGLDILVTGGHLSRPDDYFLDLNGVGSWLPGIPVRTTSTHGTGCALSSALLCELVASYTGEEAARRAKIYVGKALREAYPVGKGSGPINHLFNLR